MPHGGGRTSAEALRGPLGATFSGRQTVGKSAHAGRLRGPRRKLLCESLCQLQQDAPRAEG
eukprot:15480997-Alexandrium_andersonii.AAC.1